MTNQLDLSQPNPHAEAAMERHLAAISRVVMDANFAYDPEGLIAHQIKWMAQNCHLYVIYPVQ